jgi:hypothetical protein
LSLEHVKSWRRCWQNQLQILHSIHQLYSSIPIKNPLSLIEGGLRCDQFQL